MAALDQVFEMTLKEVRVEEVDEDLPWKVIPKKELQEYDINWCRGWEMKGGEFRFIWRTMQDVTIHSTGWWETNVE